MTTITNAALLEAVAELVRLTGTVAHEFSRNDLRTREKSDGSPVTLADLQAEQTARDWIRSRFPNDAILGEEYGEERAGSQRRWLVDPIDGTKSYVRGVPLWGALVAVEQDNTVLAGAAFFPVVGELLAAAIGEGCWLNGSRCGVSSVATIPMATVLTTDDRFPTNPERRAAWNLMASRAAVARTWGDCYGYLMVATGRAEVMVDDVCSPWDLAPMLPIISEAGGVLTDFQGNPTAFGGSAIATNRLLALEVRSLLQDK